MHKLVILIEALDDTTDLDEKWPHFLHLAEEMPGLIREATVRVNKVLYGNDNIGMIHELYFDSLEDLQKAMASPQGRSAGQVLQRITEGRITLLLADHKEDTIENLRSHKGTVGRTHLLSTKSLEVFMQARGISSDIFFLDVPTPTVETAAEAVGAHPDQIVKTLLFLVEGEGDEEEGVVAITCGTANVDLRVIASLYNVGRKKVRLAPADKVIQMTGFPVGTVPPFGHRHVFRTLMDPRVLEQEQVYAGGGSKNTLVRLSPEDILQTTQAETMDLHTPPE